MKSSSTSGGKARKKSTYAMRSRFSHLRCKWYSIATARPVATPSGTMTRESATVMPTPRARNGQARAKIAALKKTWRICSIALALPGEARLDPAARHHHRQKERQVGRRAERERRRIARLARARGGVVNDLVYRDHRAERRALGDGDHAIGERRDRQSHGLRQDDVHERLQARHAGRARRLGLPFRHREDAGPENLLGERCQHQR